MNKYFWLYFWHLWLDYITLTQSQFVIAYASQVYCILLKQGWFFPNKQMKIVFSATPLGVWD